MASRADGLGHGLNHGSLELVGPLKQLVCADQVTLAQGLAKLAAACGLLPSRIGTTVTRTPTASAIAFKVSAPPSRPRPSEVGPHGDVACLQRPDQHLLHEAAGISRASSRLKGTSTSC